MSELQYADDNCTIVHTLEDLQDSAENFSRTYTQIGLNINIAKTKVLLHPRLGHHTPPEDKITIRGLELENVDYFTYLGSILDVNATAERGVNNRIRAAHAAYRKLHTRVFSNPILRIKWQDRITNNEVLLRARTESTEATITRHRLRWSGHLARMHHNRLPKQVLFSELDSGNGARSAPKRRCKDHLKHTLKAVDIDPTNWETEAANRESWSRTIREKRDL
ncbi:uncharacterized protein LOC143031533 [Oratosquilla oratoria]|uniref:uncharacterized protein LOC143031533 n=1 Tax=Oratosquilla oratoria TaxID=337810 RepID=UPI003F767454